MWIFFYSEIAKIELKHELILINVFVPTGLFVNCTGHIDKINQIAYFLMNHKYQSSWHICLSESGLFAQKAQMLQSQHPKCPRN